MRRATTTTSDNDRWRMAYRTLQGPIESCMTLQYPMFFNWAPHFGLYTTTQGPEYPTKSHTIRHDSSRSSNVLQHSASPSDTRTLRKWKHRQNCETQNTKIKHPELEQGSSTNLAGSGSCAPVFWCDILREVLKFMWGC
jgi:hypothetical protein